MAGIKKLVFDRRIVLYGRGALNLLPQEIKKKDITHVFICTDSSLAQSELFSGFRNSLQVLSVQVTVFDKIIPNPKAEDIMEGKEQFLKSKAECIIGFGGGSVLDSAKAIAAISCNEGHILEYQTHCPSRRFLKNKENYTICIPTTAGTGSEMDGISVIVNEEGHKVNIIDTLLACDFAIVDPAVLDGCPERIVVSCGFDAMMHSFETVMGNPDMFFAQVSLRGIKLVYDCLIGAYRNRTSYYREKLMQASLIGGFSMANEPAPTLVPIHSIALPLSEKYHLSHGESLSAVAPYVMDMITELTDPGPIAKIGRYCGIEEDDDFVCARIFIMNLQEIINTVHLEIPYDISATKEDARYLAERAVRSSSTTKNGILSFDFEMCCRIYERAFGHEQIKM